MRRRFSRWIARATSLFIDALAHYLAQPVKHHSPSTADPLSLAAVLLRGDVLLTEGNTRAAALVRRVTSSTWSHVSMYVGPLEDGPDPRCIVEAAASATHTTLPMPGCSRDGSCGYRCPPCFRAPRPRWRKAPHGSFARASWRKRSCSSDIRSRRITAPSRHAISRAHPYSRW